MDNHTKRLMCLQQIKATLLHQGQNDDTISIKGLISEIMRVYMVTYATAEKYINELVMMGIARREGDFLWHRDEKELRLEYLSNNASDEKESKLNALDTKDSKLG